MESPLSILWGVVWIANSLVSGSDGQLLSEVCNGWLLQQSPTEERVTISRPAHFKIPRVVVVDSMKVGTTVNVKISDCRDGYLKAERDGCCFSISGEGNVGETRTIRVIKNREDDFIAVTEGASIRLRIDETVDDSTVRADPSYGPVFISSSLTPGDWWRCTVTDIKDDCITARPINYIPRNSDIPKGSPPEDPAQSLNHLLSGRGL